jgi:hypothetical protein
MEALMDQAVAPDARRASGEQGYADFDEEAREVG